MEKESKNKKTWTTISIESELAVRLDQCRRDVEELTGAKVTRSALAAGLLIKALADRGY